MTRAMPAAPGASRVARGALAGLVTTALAAISHDLAGGALPAAGPFVAVAVLAVLVCTAAAGRARGTWAIAACVAAGQGVFHLMFTACAATSGTVGVVAPGGSGHAMTGMADAVVAVPGGRAGAPVGAMVAMHGLAFLVTVLVLTRTETAWAAARRLATVVARVLLPALPGGVVRVVRPGAPCSGGGRAVVVPAVRWGGVSRRGPPLSSIA